MCQCALIRGALTDAHSSERLVGNLLCHLLVSLVCWYVAR